MLDTLLEGDEERCGIVRPDGTYIEIPNIHEKPTVGFRMEPGAFLREIEAGATETWHTHPGRDPTLSEEDMMGFRAWPQLTHHIIGVRDGEPAVMTYKVIEGGIVVKA